MVTNHAMRFALIVSLLTLVGRSTCAADKAEADRFKKQLAEIVSEESTISRRRLCKRLVRNVEPLLETCAPADRYPLLQILFEAQQTLLCVDDSERNRKALLKTTQALAAAPPEFAEVRLPADLLLTQVSLSEPDLPEAEVTEALCALITRYKDTKAEADCLMAVATMAKQKGLGELLNTVRKTLEERCNDVPKVKAFTREFFAASDRQFVFRAVLKRLDGTTLRFPTDRLGHTYLVVFWSETDEAVNRRLLEIERLRGKYGNRFEIYSCNLDERPDCGQRILKRLQLDWTPLQCTGGLQNDAYLAHGRVNEFPFAFLVINELGYGRGRGYNWGGYNPAGEAATMSPVESEMVRVLSSRQTGIRDPSYFALMQSLLIGDFLVTEPYGPTDPLMPVELQTFSVETGEVTKGKLERNDNSIPEQALGEIQACFPPPSVRCRLTPAEALAHYQKAAEQCAALLQAHPKALEAALLRNRRIIALMGLWKLTRSDVPLKQAADLSHKALPQDESPASRIVPLFCRARCAIRENPEEAAGAIEVFLSDCGGDEAPGVAYAAATLLAMEACNRDLFLTQRLNIATRFDNDRRTWPVTSFFLQRATVVTLFRASGTYSRGYLEDDNRTGALRVDRFPALPFQATFTTLGGKQIAFPADTEKKHCIVVFLKPPADEDALALQKELLNGYDQATQHHRHKELQLMAVYLTDSPEAIKSLVADQKWTFDVACVPGGINSSTAIRLGAYAEDRLPKTYLVGPDGRIEKRYDSLLVTHSYHGLPISRDRHGKLFIHRSVKGVIRAYDIALGRQALEAENYTEAANRLHISFPKAPVNSYNRQARYSFKANYALGNWKEALRDIDICLKDPSWRSKSWRARDKSTREELLKKIKDAGTAGDRK